MSTTARTKALQKYLASDRTKSELEILAVQRQLDDLTHGHRRGLVWNEDEAQRALNFFKHLRHWKGQWAGSPLELETFQNELIIAPIFGWYREDGTRRITEAYIELSRKNGKSTLAAGVGLKMLVADNEQGAEVYAAATKHQQAMIVFNDAKQMVAQSPELTKRTEKFKWSLHHPSSSSVFSPLASDENNLDGLNSHCNIIDELHQHRTRGVYDKLVTSHGARRNPLDFVITTAGIGDDPHSIALERHDYADKVLRGISEDDSLWPFIANAEREDDWTDPDVWAKANPNLGVSVSRRFLFDQCTRAKHSLAYENVFRRFYLNQWVEQSVRWLSMKRFDRAKSDRMPDLTHRSCFVGLDLADTSDINAMALYFPDVDGHDYLKLHCWCPDDTIQDRLREGKFAYGEWVRDGWIETTNGAVTDYNVILARIYELGQQYEIIQVAYDPWNALSMVNQLDDAGFSCVKVTQHLASMAPGTKEFERRLLDGQLRHDGNPVLRWMASNVCVQGRNNEAVRPDRHTSSEKIDGIVAAIMALSRAMVGDMGSVYESRGILEL